MNLTDTAAWVYQDNCTTILGVKGESFGDEPDRHHVRPQANGGQSARGNLVKVTPNFHRGVHVYLALLGHFAGRVPLTVRWHFPTGRRGLPGIRDIANLGWARMGGAS